MAGTAGQPARCGRIADADRHVADEVANVDVCSVTPRAQRSYGSRCSLTWRAPPGRQCGLPTSATGAAATREAVGPACCP
jgi:hypothetical protein